MFPSAGRSAHLRADMLLPGHPSRRSAPRGRLVRPESRDARPKAYLIPLRFGWTLLSPPFRKGRTESSVVDRRTPPPHGGETPTKSTVCRFGYHGGYHFAGFPSAAFTTSATESGEISWRLQYSDCSQAESSRFPLLALHETQQRAMFSRVTILTSLTMCSHVACDPLRSSDDANRTRQ